MRLEQTPISSYNVCFNGPIHYLARS